MSTSTTAYRSTPALSVGGRLDEAAMDNLLSVTVHEDCGGLVSCEARFTNWGSLGRSTGYLYLDRKVFDFGTELRVRFGAGAGEELFFGRVSALHAEFPPLGNATLMVSAEDRLQDFRMTRRTRTFERVSTPDVARRLCSDHGLDPDVSLDGPTRTVVNQLNLSDLAFLRELARRDDAELWVSGRRLHLARRPDRDAGRLTLTYGGDLLAFDVRADLAHQVTDVVVTGWSVADKSAIEESAGRAVLGSELGSDVPASQIIAEAFAERHERLVVTEPLASDDARSRAKAAYLARSRRFVCGCGTTAGTATLRVGTVVKVVGVSPLFEGEYRVSSTRHHFDIQDGYSTDFEVERAGIGSTGGAS